ncbi:MAG: flippase activity-associated protein Agl23 [Halanaeroarchaeum sp.]
MSRLKPARDFLEWATERVPGVNAPTTLVIALFTLLALLARLVFLGQRVAHYDEARVGYWILHYVETGSFAYRSIIHGPFIQQVDALLFSLVGASDFVARLPVAIVGGLLPLSAYLYREHLRDLEVVALSGFLAFNPVLLYYSRFMRSDVLVAAFMFVALGFLVRFYDTREIRYLYGISFFTALGFASKENALLYQVTWVGAAALLADQALFRPRSYPNGLSLLLEKTGYLRERLGDLRERPVDFLRGYPLNLFGSAILFFVVSLYFYAPRGKGLPGLYFPRDASGDWVGLWEAVLNPTKLSQLVDRTVSYTLSEYAYWLGQGGTPPRLDMAASRQLTGNGTFVDQLAVSPTLADAVSKAMELFVAAYLLTLQGFLDVLALKAMPLAMFALLGFVYERYVADTSRNLVLFSSYAGVASLLGYGLGADIFGPWLVVHAILPLAIPAAAGLGRVASWGIAAADDEDDVSLVVFAFLLLLVGSVAGLAVTSVYVGDQAGSNKLVQYAQPAGDMKPTLRDLDRISTNHRNGADVIVYSGASWEPPLPRSVLVRPNVRSWQQRTELAYRPACIKWFNMLPMSWYFEMYDTRVDCTRSPSELSSLASSGSPPPVLITAYEDKTVPRETLRKQGYTAHTYRLRAMKRPLPLSQSAPNERRVTFWIHEEWAG